MNIRHSDRQTALYWSGSFVMSCSAESGINSAKRKRGTHTHTPTCICRAANVQQKSITSPAGVLVWEKRHCKDNFHHFALKSKVRGFVAASSGLFPFSKTMLSFHGALCCSSMMRHSLPTSAEQQ